MSKQNSDYYFLQGGGEMGQLIRAKDWSKTSLGNPANWPQSLCTMVAVMLDNPFGMYIAWGDDYTQLYNDGYRPILGATKHPQALGISTRETFSEIWHIIGSMFDGVMQGTAVGFPDFMLPLNRNGFVEECFFDFSYSPIRKDNGEVGGVLVTVIETTNKHHLHDSIEKSNKKIRTLIAQAPVAMCLYKDQDFTVDIVNEKMLQIWGKSLETVISKPIFEAMPDAKGQGFEDLLNKVYTTGERFSANGISIDLSRNGVTEKIYVNLLYEPYIEPDGTISGIVEVANDVTEQVLSRIKIEESEQEIRKIKDDLDLSITAGKIGVWRWDVKQDVLYWSKEQQVIYGLEPSADLLNVAQFKTFVIPEDWDRLNKDLQSAPIAEEQEYDFRIIRKNDGKIRWIKSRAKNILSENGELAFVSGVNIDITEQMEALKVISESEERFHSLAQSLPQLVWVTDPKGFSLFASSRWKDYTGIEPEGQEEWKAIVHPDDYDDINAAWLHSLTTGTIYRHTVRLICKTGEYRWNTVVGEPVLGENNEIVKWVGAFTDVHEQKIAEEAIKKSDEQFSTLANNIQNLAWIADGEGYIFWYNQRWYDYTGTTLEEMKGWGWEKVHHPEHIDRVVEFVKQAWPKSEPFELTFPLRGKDGNYRWFLTRAFPVTDTNGKINSWIGTNTDIQEQKTFSEQLEEKVNERTIQLNQLNENLQEKNLELQNMNKELEAFTYISSHDLQEPLRKIQTFAGRIIATDNDTLSDTSKEYFSRMNLSAERMRILIEDLLAFSRIGTLDRKFETTDLNKIVEEVKEEFKEILAEKQATIEASELCSVKVIPFQFRQLMQNLISNALKFSKHDEPSHIIIKSKIMKGNDVNNENLLPQKKYCHISVSDNGIGFEEQFAEKIFQVFQKLHDRQQYTGTGIGLSIVKKIVDNHNGFITTESELGKGATFNIYLPIR